MNYLAHLLLSGPDPDLALGNFLADMLTPDQSASMPPRVLEGIMLHRAIDTFTDAHPIGRTSTARIRATQRKYAPVSIDVYYDFLLVRHWTNFASIPMEEMAAFTYAQLGARMNIVPEPLQPRVRSMIHHQWLETYRTQEGINQVFSRMSKRASQPEIFLTALNDLKAVDHGLQQDLLLFFPDIIDHVLDIHPKGNPWIIPRNGKRSIGIPVGQ